jgi:cytochrome c biogenesis factor
MNETYTYGGNESSDSSELPTFDVPSFKLGLYFGFQAMMLAINVNYLMNPKLGKFPFLIQIMFCVANIFYNTSFFTEDKSSLALEIVGNFFDTFTKWMVIYFVCFKLIIVLQFKHAQRKQIWYFLLVTGALLAALANFTYMMASNSFLDTNAFYAIADIYISLVEIASFYEFITFKFTTSSFKELYSTIVSLELAQATIIMILSLVVSIVFAGVQNLGFDDDLNYNAILATIKYHVSCKITLIVFERAAFLKQGKNSSLQLASITKQVKNSKNDLSRSPNRSTDVLSNI